MDCSANTQSHTQVIHVQKDDEGVHQVLLHVHVCKMYKLNIFFFSRPRVFIIKYLLQPVMVRLLREVELDEEKYYDKSINDNGPNFLVAFNLYVSIFAEYLDEDDPTRIAEAKEYLDAICK